MRLTGHHAARSVERGSIDLDPVAEQHHRDIHEKKFATARDGAAPLARTRMSNQ